MPAKEGLSRNVAALEQRRQLEALIAEAKRLIGDSQRLLKRIDEQQQNSGLSRNAPTRRNPV
jgi:hypothetical protein